MLKITGYHRLSQSVPRSGGKHVLTRPITGECPFFPEASCRDATRLGTNRAIRYIGTNIAYGQGSYETSDRASRTKACVEPVLMHAMQQLLQK